MQFGKFHGWAFIALGALLILVQLALVFSPKQQVGTPETPAVTRPTTAIPGIIARPFAGVRDRALRDQPQ